MSLGGGESQKVSQEYKQDKEKFEVRVGSYRVVSFGGG